MDLSAKWNTVIRAIVGLPADRGTPPDLLRLGRYRASVVQQNADGTLDLHPEDTRIPSAQNVKMRVPFPAAVVKVQTGAVVLLGWEKGDPQRPYATPEWEDGATLVSIFIGSSPEEVLTKSDLAAFLFAWQNAVVGGSDGGALMRTNTIAALQLPPPTGPGWPAAAAGIQCGSKAFKVQR